MFGKIYKISNSLNNKVYIGQTIQKLGTRFSRHKQTQEMRCPHLSNAMDKYGKENFFIEQIDIANNKKELDEKELYWIKFYDAIEDGYNIVDEHYKSLKRVQKNNIKNLKVKVCKFDLNGNYIKTYNSAAEAAIDLNVRGSDITTSCVQRQYSVKGFIFVYLEDKENLELLKCKINKKGKYLSFRTKEIKEKIKNFSMYYHLKKFTQKEELKICKEYYYNKISQEALANKYNCSRNLIIKSIDRILKTSLGNEFKNLRKTKILQIDKNTNKTINTFNDMKEAARYIGLKSISSRALTPKENGTERVTNGYKWRKIQVKEDQQKIEKIIGNEQ